MIDFQLAPCIIAGLICLMGYMLARWTNNISQVHNWQAVAEMGFRRNDELYEEIAAMKAEGCRAMGALENIFNGVTAGGMPHSKLVRKIADVATDALTLCAPCDHKEEVDDLREAVVEVQDEADNLAGELLVAKRNAEGWQGLAVESQRRMEAAEHLLGLANDRLIVLRSEREPTPLPYAREDDD